MVDEKPIEPKRQLIPDECAYYRDRLREARYAALANAEGFETVCFAVEEFGRRLAGGHQGLGTYRKFLRWYAQYSPTTNVLVSQYPDYFSSFDTLFEAVYQARNDVMHSGVYARHVTERAVDLCIALEEAIMAVEKARSHRKDTRTKVGDYMVKTPISIQKWQPVALARQLMLTHSFSFLPVSINSKWQLVSERAIVDYLYNQSARTERLASSIEEAFSAGELSLVDAITTTREKPIQELLDESKGHERQGENAQPLFTLWLVVGANDSLVGVLSPFELM
ncbi:hypothetical protein GCM10027081_61540 [Cupriavidus yeoncheonensis]